MPETTPNVLTEAEIKWLALILAWRALGRQASVEDIIECADWFFVPHLTIAKTDAA